MKVETHQGNTQKVGNEQIKGEYNTIVGLGYRSTELNPLLERFRRTDIWTQEETTYMDKNFKDSSKS